MQTPVNAIDAAAPGSAARGGGSGGRLKAGTSVASAPARGSIGPAPVLYLEFYAALGGAELYLIELLGRLDRARFRPVVATPGTGELARALRADGVAVAGVGGYAHLVTYAASGREVLGNARRFAATTAALRRLARRERTALIHAFITPAFKYAGLVGRSLGRPVVGTLHDTLAPELGWTWPRRRALITNVNLLFDRVVCVSEAVRRAAIRAGGRPDRLVTIHNGVDAARYRAAPAEGARVRAEWGVPADAVLVGVIGRYTAGKGQGTFVEAMQPLLAARPDLWAVLVGGAVFEPERHHLAEIERRIAVARVGAAGTGWAGRIRLDGWRTDMAAVLAALDVVVVPSTLPDSLPGVALQAMAAGRPVVGSRIGGIPEIVLDGETGRLVPPGDAGALGGAIAALVDDPVLRVRYGAAGARRVERAFRLDRSVQRLEALYAELLRGQV